MQNQKKFSRAYLHIGLGKTGTSAIQLQLYENAALLEREQDIHYPRVFTDPVPFDGNHSRFLAAMFVGKEGLNRAQIVAGFKSPQDMAPYSAKLREQFESGFAATAASRLLISAEGIGHFSRPRLLMLSSWLEQFADEIEIVACFRHPLDALSSEIQQRLKQGRTLEELYEKPPLYNFRNLFDRLGRAFPDSAVNVYDFSKAVADPRGLTAVFLENIGLNGNLPAPVSQYTNPSMTHEAALLLGALNRVRPLVVDNSPNKLRSPKDVMDFMGIPGRKYQAPPEVYARANEMAADDLNWLQGTHGIKLHARPVKHELDHNYFSNESIEKIALRLSKLSQLRYEETARFRSVMGTLRLIRNKIRQKIT